MTLSRAHLLPILTVLGVQLLSAPAPVTEPDPSPVLLPPPTPEVTDRSQTNPGPPTRVEFLGANTFRPAELEKALEDSLNELRQRGLTPPRADDTAFYLGAFYRKQGFPDVSVDWELRGRALLLRINEGPRTYLRELRLSGHRALDRKTLFGYLLGAAPERLDSEPTSFPYVQSEVQAGANRVRALYHAEGFLDAVVEDPQLEFSPDRRSAVVRIAITEGQRYTFGPVTFSGASPFGAEELTAQIEDELDGPFTPDKALALQRSLQYFLRTRGYYDAQVESVADPKKALQHKVPVSFIVKTGALYRFHGVDVLQDAAAEKRGRLRPDFFPKRFAAFQGAPYSPARIDKSYRELLHTGLFRSLRITPKPQPNQTIRLEIQTEEAKAREVGFSVGGSSYEGLELGLRLGDRNLFGTGRPLTFSLDTSRSLNSSDSRNTGRSRIRGELLYVDPWFLETHYNLRARLFAQGRSEIGYSKEEQGIRADLGRKLTEKIELAAFLQLKNVKIPESKPGITASDLGPTSYQIGSLGVTQSFDFRDNPINPAKGWILTGAFDVNYVNGELSFTRSTLRGGYYRALPLNLQLALGARMGTIQSLLGDVPLDERYFNGGATSVRSFTERTLGPKDSENYPIGGELFSVFNAEVTFPLYGALQGAAFIDAGNVLNESSGNALEDMRYAVGLGLRYKLPIGPLRLDYGRNPSPNPGERNGAFHFTFGFAF